MSLLVVGSTGTLGSQVVRKALTEGFQVKCLVRNLREASFLKEWGADLIYGDLSLPETIPLALDGITAIIDASTSRSSDNSNTQKVDLYGKITLIRAAKTAHVKRFIFFSIFNADKYPNVLLMRLKAEVETILKTSEINYTIFTLCGFFQGIINQYAIPILDQKPVWITSESTQIAYIDTQDISTFAVRSLSIPYLENKKLPLVGYKSWTATDIIQLCEKLSGRKSRISYIPVTLLRFLRILTNLFQWSWNISERLAFTEVITSGENFTVCMNLVYNIFQISPQQTNFLEQYLSEYFSRIMKRLQELNYQKNNIKNLF